MPPDLSVVVVAPFGVGPVRQLVRFLARQTIRTRMEIVLAVPAKSLIDEAGQAALGGFDAVRVLETGPMTSLPAARALCVTAASAPVVVLTEDHCFPAPGWAEALVRAHEGPWAAVGPMFEPPVPDHPRARAACLMQYGPWTHPTSGGDVEDLPGHNSSYKRDVLLAYGDALPRLLAAESALHWDLRRRGYRLRLEPDARVRHVFMTRFGASLREALYIGRSFAATRAREWSVRRRAVFALGSPLIPLVRLRRLVRRSRELGWHRHLPAVIPSLLPLLAVSACGEFTGYAFGIGRAVATGVDMDTRRDRFVSDAERAALWSDGDDLPAALAGAHAAPR